MATHSSQRAFPTRRSLRERAEAREAEPPQDAPRLTRRQLREHSDAAPAKPLTRRERRLRDLGTPESHSSHSPEHASRDDVTPEPRGPAPASEAAVDATPGGTQEDQTLEPIVLPETPPSSAHEQTDRHALLTMSLAHFPVKVDTPQDATPLRIDVAGVGAAGASSPTRRRVSRTSRTRKIVVSATGIAWAGTLAVAMAFPGVWSGSAAEAANEPSPANIAIPQIERTGAAYGFDHGALDALGTVTVTEEDEGANFYNFADAEVQFPFPMSVTLTDGFAYRVYPVEQFHDAQDFAAPAGTPIQAIADGVVIEAGWAYDGCGFALTLEHRIDGNDVTSRYCHMQADSHSHKLGDRLRVGDQVGLVGQTGLAFGNHLHLALRLNNEPIDPLPFLTKYNKLTRPASQ